MAKNKKIDSLVAKTGLDYHDKMFVLENDCGLYFQPWEDEYGEMLDVESARKKYGLKKYFWQLIDPQADKVTKAVFKAKTNGYFIRSFKQKQRERSRNGQYQAAMESCLLATKAEAIQKVHNVIIAEENSSLEVLTGCTAPNRLKASQHYGVTEIFVKKNAQVVFTMVHSWGNDSQVFPKTAVKVEEGGTFVSNYLLFDPVKKLLTNPCVYLEGKSSRGVLKSFVFSHPQSDIDVGGVIHLKGKKSRGEIVANIVAKGGKTLSQGTLIGEEEEIKAHLECNAIVLSNKAVVKTIPVLQSQKENLEMSHEASIGKISGKEIEYLQSRGIAEERAKQMIVRGFVDRSLGNLSSSLQMKVEEVVQSAAKGI